MKEIWRPVTVVGYNYEVSNKGGIKSELGLMKPTLSHGYYRVCLYRNDGTHKMFQLHRLIAQAFIPNPENLPQVNHIDENKLNNCVENLEWVTAKKNCNHRTRNERISNSKLKKINQLTLSGELVRAWDGALSVEKETGLSCRYITKCCRGERKTAYGYVWQYVN